MTKKYSLIIFLLLGAGVARGQEITRQDANSILKALDKSKGNERIELLLNLAQFHIFKPGEDQIDFDSAAVYINQAKDLSKSVNSPAARGYLLLTESYLIKERGRKEEGKKVVEEAITILESGNNKAYRGRAYYELSMYYDYKDSIQLSKKIALVQQSIDAFQQAGDLIGEGRSLEMLGDLNSGMGEYDKAIAVLKQALAVYDSAKYQKLQGVYVLLGTTYGLQADHRQALFYLLKALKFAQMRNDTSMQLCQINNSLGVLYANIGRRETAIKYLNDAIEIAKKHKDEYSIFLMAATLSATFNELDQPEQSFKALVNIPKKLLISDDLYVKALANICYFRTYLGLKRLSNAQQFRDTLLMMADKKLVPEPRRSNIYRFIATYYFLIHQYPKAQYYLRKSFDIVESINFEIGRIQNLGLLYKLDSAQGNSLSAFNHLLFLKKKTDSVSSEQTLKQFQVLGVEYEVGMKEDSIKLKDKDILLLTQTNRLQRSGLQRASLIKKVTIGGIILAFIIIGLLFNRYRLKQKTNKKLERQRAEIEKQNLSLQNLVHEKEWLLKEIHHRVKNNLQIVMSLLNSQSRYIDNEPALTAIHDSQHRVHAMSLIHQKLYSSDNVSTIDMSVYIHELTSYLKDSFNSGQRIRFEYHIEPLVMDVGQSVPLGLILNEAITNSLKYAFPDERTGTIVIALSNPSDKTWILGISDNGIGIPANFNDNNSGSLGMRLMKGLSEDLEGSFSIEGANGTTVRIFFEHELAINSHASLESTFQNT